MERHLDLLVLELEVVRCREHKSLAAILHHSVIEAFLVDLVERRAQHVIDDALLALLTHNLHLVLCKALIIDLASILGLSNDF